MKAIPFLFLLLLSCGLFAQSNEAISSGIIDLHHSRLNESTQALNGTCKFFMGQLLTPEECKSSSGKIIEFPSLFYDGSSKESGMGYATYELTVLLPSDQKEIALAIPQIYSCYSLWANGNIIAKNGKVGKLKEECKPQWRPQTVALKVESDTLTLVLQVANFHHAKGGIKESIYIGQASMMKFKRTVSETSKLVEASALFIIGLFFLLIFLFYRSKKAALYFALLCMTWATRSLFSNLYLFVFYFPDFDWTAMVRIEYISLYLTMIWSILFLSSLFQNEANVIIKYGLVICNLLFTVFTLSSTPWAFTQGLTLYLIMSGMLLLYGIYVIVRAWVNERTGSGLLTISIILGLNIFGYDIFVYEGFSSYDPVIFSGGYIFIFILMGLGLASYLNLIKGKPGVTTLLTYDDLYKNQ